MKFLIPPRRPNAARRLNDHYSIYDVSFDEEVTSDELMSSHRFEADIAKADFDDARRSISSELASLVANTTREAERFNVEHNGQEQEVSLTLLIDHSGSMRGSRLQLAFALAEATSQMASKLKISFEILGFTTVAWHGEPVRRHWMTKGGSDAPGRLCALRHIIYSKFEDSKQPDMKAMYLPHLLRENVDGEAILWAADRARSSSAKKHVLLVVSDGAPVDEATLTHNPADFLWQHLLSVSDALKYDADFIVGGVGIDHNVERIYNRAIELRFFGDLENAFLPFLSNCMKEAGRLPNGPTPSDS